jgi:hypothetical protein
MNILARISGLIGIVMVSPAKPKAAIRTRYPEPPRRLAKSGAIGDSSGYQHEEHLRFVRGPSFGAAFVRFYSIVISLLRLLRFTRRLTSLSHISGQ